jgi:hypothetical protein
MRLADNEITITVGGERIHLRPSLRAAFRLERQHGGFDGIIRAVLDGSLSVIASVVTESSDRWASVPAFLKSIDAMPAKIGIDDLSVSVLDHVLTLAGIDPANKTAPKASTNPITHLEYHTRLYRIATGWIGWTPEAAWNATPAEILEACKGRKDMIDQTLKAVFGGSEAEETPQGPVTHTEEQIQASRATLKAMSAAGNNMAAM